MPSPTPPASSRWGFKLGCERPMLAPTSHLETHGGPPRPIIIENRLPPARWSVDPPAASASPRVKRPRGRPRMYRPMPVKTGDELENPVSVDVALENPRMHRPSAAGVVSMVMKRGIPAKAQDARPAEAGGNQERDHVGGRPRKEKPAGAMSAQAGDAASADRDQERAYMGGQERRSLILHRRGSRGA